MRLGATVQLGLMEVIRHILNVKPCIKYEVQSHSIKILSFKLIL